MYWKERSPVVNSLKHIIFKKCWKLKPWHKSKARMWVIFMELGWIKSCWSKSSRRTSPSSWQASLPQFCLYYHFVSFWPHIGVLCTWYNPFSCYLKNHQNLEKEASLTTVHCSLIKGNTLVLWRPFKWHHVCSKDHQISPKPPS